MSHLNRAHLIHFDSWVHSVIKRVLLISVGCSDTFLNVCNGGQQKNPRRWDLIATSIACFTYISYILASSYTRVDQLLSLWNCGARGLCVVLKGQLPPQRIIWINIRGLTVSLSGFNGCGTQDQNSADGQHSGVRRDHLVLGLLQDPGPIRRARAAREAVGSETARQECQSYELHGQTVHSQKARATRRCGL